MQGRYGFVAIPAAASSAMTASRSTDSSSWTTYTNQLRRSAAILAHGRTKLLHLPEPLAVRPRYRGAPGEQLVRALA